MYCCTFLFVTLLTAGSNLPEAFCFDGSRQHNYTAESQYESSEEEARIKYIEIITVEDLEDGVYSLFPMDMFTMCEEDLKPEEGPQREDASVAGHPKISKRIYAKTKSKSGWKSPREIPISSGARVSVPRHQAPYNSTFLLECMLNAVKTSLPPVLPEQASNSVKDFFGMIGGLFVETCPTQPAAIAISPDTLKAFVTAATICFHLFKQDKKGQLVLDKNFATSTAVEAIKLRPMGVLAVAATTAIVENVSVKYCKNREPQYIINHTGMAMILGTAALKSTKVGQIATKSTEGSNWLSDTVSKVLRGRTGQTPTNVIALLECVLNASLSSLTLPSIYNQASSLIGNQASSTVLDLFVQRARPCFGYFKRNKDGQLVLDESFVSSAAAKAIKSYPVGTLALESSQAIADNVNITHDKVGKLKYNINYARLATRLGNVIHESTDVGQATPLEGCSSLKGSIRQIIMGGCVSAPCSEMPDSLPAVMKCLRTCVTRCLEGRSWLATRVIHILQRRGSVTARNQTPTNPIDLLVCVSNAAVTSLFGGISGASYTGDTIQKSGEPANAVTSKELNSFVMAASPCFGSFKRSENGYFILDQVFLQGIAAEAIRMFRLGALALRSLEAIADNVSTTLDKGGKINYIIDYPGLGSGLGMTVLRSTTYGQLAIVGSRLVTSFLRWYKGERDVA